MMRSPMPPRPLALTLLSINIIVGIISIAILALCIHSVSLTDGMALPSNTQGTGRAILFWPGCGGIIDMFVFVIIWSVLAKKELSKSWTTLLWNTEVFVASFVFGRPFIVLVYTFVEHNHADKNPWSVRTGGYVTPETWGCSARSSAVRNTGKLCRDLKSARWLLVPEVVLGAVVLGLTVWARVKVGRVRKGQIVKTRGDC